MVAGGRLPAAMVHWLPSFLAGVARPDILSTVFTTPRLVTRTNLDEVTDGWEVVEAARALR